MTILPHQQPRRRQIGQVLSVTLALAALGTVAAFLIPFGTQRSASAEPVIPAGVSLTSWFDNGSGGQHVLQIVKGNAPPAGVRVVGAVTTDTDCDPDPIGLNHCHNRIDLADGGSIEVIHNHAMHRYPCLAPGQRLSITGLDAEWAVADRRQPPRTE